MELTAIHGIGPEYARRLRDAHVEDAEALVTHQDLPRLAEETGIAVGRLAAFQEAAVDLIEPSGIILATPSPLHELAQTLHRAWDDARDEARARWADLRDDARTRRERLQAEAEGRAADALATMSSRLHMLRERVLGPLHERRRGAA